MLARRLAAAASALTCATGAIAAPAPYRVGRTPDGQFEATDEPGYEYACHEGNYALASVLRGARKKEQDAAEAAKKSTAVKAPGPALSAANP